MRGCLDAVLCAAAVGVVMGFAATSFEVEDVFVMKLLTMLEEQRRSQNLELAVD